MSDPTNQQNNPINQSQDHLNTTGTNQMSKRNTQTSINAAMPAGSGPSTVHKAKELKLARASQKSAQKAATRKMDDLNKLLQATTIDVEDLEDIISLLNQKEEDVTLADAKVQSLIEDDDDLERESDAAIAFREDISTLKLRANRAIKKLHQINGSQSANSNYSGSTQIVNNQQPVAPPPVAPRNHPKLPEITIPTFSGDHTKWNSFWGRFTAIIDKQNFSKVEKFIYLVGYLEGEALQAVKGYDEVDDSYDQAVTVLKKRYEKHDLAVHLLYNNLQEFQPVLNSNNVKALRIILDTCESSIRSLKGLGIDTSVKAEAFCPKILAALPKDIRTAYCVRRKVPTNGSSWDPDDLIEFIREQVESREMSDLLVCRATTNNAEGTDKNQDRYRNKPNNHSHRASASQLVTGVNQQPSQLPDRIYCLFCKNTSHKTLNCPNYTLDQKCTIIRDCGRCFICLRLYHDTSRCRSRFKTCKSCNKAHNFSLCERNPAHKKPVHQTRTQLVAQVRNNQYVSQAQNQMYNSGSPYNEPNQVPNPANYQMSHEDHTQGKFQVQSQDPTKMQSQAPPIYYTSSQNQANDQVQTSVKSIAMTMAPIKTSHEKILLQRTLAVAKNPLQPKNSLIAKCFLDGGSQGSFIREDLAVRLKLPVVGDQELDVYSFGNKDPHQRKHKRVKVTLENKENPEETVEIVAVVQSFLAYDFSNSNDLEIREILQTKGIKLADDPVLENDEDHPDIDILIGADYYWEIVSGKTERLGPRTVALETKLGWCLSGPEKSSEWENSRQSVTSMLISLGEQRVNKTLKSFFDLESLGIDSSEIKENPNDQALTTFFEDIKFDQNQGRYVVKFPWKVSKESLPNNLPVAIKRAQSLERKFEKDQGYYERYKAVINEQLELGIAEVVPEDQVQLSKPGTYYMPHQGVEREHVKTTKTRVVLDGSSHSYGKPSLNECLLPGPNLNPNLLLLLLRFRYGKVAIVADIEKAFLQIALDEPDKDSVRFIWFREEDGRIKKGQYIILRMTRVPFGVTSSPFLLGCTIKYHVMQDKEIPENLRKVMNNDLYVDDLISSLENVDEAYKVSVGAANLIKEAGMRFRKWGTNSQELRSLWTEHDNKENPVLFEQNTDTSENKVLGVKWNPNTDKFAYDLTSLITVSKNMRFTKRQVLSFLAQIFDPLGLISPFTIRAKMLLQILWESKETWDTELPQETKKIFQTWVKELPILQQVQIDRCYFFKTTDDIAELELHCFCDASQKAYATSVYLRYVTVSNQVGVSLIAAKSRVAPLKNQDTSLNLKLPKLELMGCLLGARLTNNIKQTFTRNVVGTFFWTDSMIALAWVTGNTNQWKPFVSNRAIEIQKLTERENWFHCPGKDNPADLPTRGLCAGDLKDDSKWWEGPPWLKESKVTWPRTCRPSESDLEPVASERRKITLAVNLTERVGLQNLIDLSKYYHLDKIFRITAYLFRFALNAKGLKKLTGAITAEEMQKAEILWVKSIQANEYGPEIRQIKNGEEIYQNSKIAPLKPILNEHGILCVGGRLGESSLSYAEKHPIIMPRSDRLTKLLVIRSHKQVQHGGISDTVTQLRERYWVPAARQLARTVVKDCIVCKRLRARPGDMPTAPLPRDRIDQSPPFSIIGIDFAGPLIAKTNNQEQKTYICLATCAVTRAIHLELVPSLSTDDFLLAFRRIISRRGVPQIIYTDNAKTFKKANSDLKIIWQNIKQDQLKEFFGRHGIKWKFIIERAAWYGGWWERLVRSTKTCLKRCLGKAFLNYTELETVLIESEALINSRPITYNYNDLNEPIPLTPAEFLVGRRLNSLPPLTLKINESVPTSRQEMTKRLRYRETMIEKIWKRWRHEYIMELRSAHHSKTVKNETKFKIGDVVLIYEEKIPRHMWNLGLVTDLIIGRDNKIRSCVVKTKNNSFIRRSVQHLCNLEIGDYA